MNNLDDIKLKINTAELLSSLIDIDDMHVAYVSLQSPVKRDIMAYEAIFQEVKDKLHKKYIDKKRTAEDFNLKLKYYEAVVLHRAMGSKILCREAQIFYSKLDQKLA